MIRIPTGAFIALALAGIAAAALYLLGRPGAIEQAGLPTDCGSTPSAYHPGTLVDWPASGTAQATRVAGGAELFARVRFDTGRMVLAYNATPGRPDSGQRVVVAEFRCVHRTIHVLTELGAPAAQEATRSTPRAH